MVRMKAAGTRCGADRGSDIAPGFEAGGLIKSDWHHGNFGLYNFLGVCWMKTILVTGLHGKTGRQVAKALMQREGIAVRGAGRNVVNMNIEFRLARR
jgi:hypothetical protein